MTDFGEASVRGRVLFLDLLDLILKQIFAVNLHLKMCAFRIIHSQSVHGLYIFECIAIFLPCENYN